MVSIVMILQQIRIPMKKPFPKQKPAVLRCLSERSSNRAQVTMYRLPPPLYQVMGATKPHHQHSLDFCLKRNPRNVKENLRVRPHLIFLKGAGNVTSAKITISKEDLIVIGARNKRTRRILKVSQLIAPCLSIPSKLWENTEKLWEHKDYLLKKTKDQTDNRLRNTRNICDLLGKRKVKKNLKKPIHKFLRDGTASDASTSTHFRVKAAKSVASTNSWTTSALASLRCRTKVLNRCHSNTSNRIKCTNLKEVNLPRLCPNTTATSCQSSSILRCKEASMATHGDGDQLVKWESK